MFGSAAVDENGGPEPRENNMKFKSDSSKAEWRYESPPRPPPFEPSTWQSFVTAMQVIFGPILLVLSIVGLLVSLSRLF